MEIDELEELLGTDTIHGLMKSAAAERLQKTGLNALEEAGRRSIVKLLFQQFTSPLLIILFSAALISAVTGHPMDGLAIAAIAVLNGIIGFLQEHRAEKSIAALNRMAAPSAIVRREGAWESLPAAQLVPGDIVRLKAGDIVPADLRLWESARLQVEEAALTGESEPVDKSEEDALSPDAPMAERTTMAFSSTLVTQGTGIGIVTATGMHTEMGRIAGLMAETEEPQTPLQRRMAGLSRLLVATALGVVGVVAAIGLWHGMDTMEIFNTAISLSVSAIPEGLPTIVTIVLTIGSRAMARQSALTRQLASVETLGTTSVICTDKTGTLTQNQMQVMRLWAGGHHLRLTGHGFDPAGEFLDPAGRAIEPSQDPDLMDMLTVSVLCNEADMVRKDGRAAIQGNPTEGALAVAAAKAGLMRDQLLDNDYRVLAQFPFDSKRKMMSFHLKHRGGRETLMAKGAPDRILTRCTHIRLNGETLPLTDALRQEVGETIRGFGGDALRTLAIAKRDAPGREIDPDMPEQDLVLLGIHGIMDPPREEVGPAISQAQAAGIRIIMITGDHAVTAQAIARQIGILTPSHNDVFSGSEIETMDDAELERAVETAAVFARVTPADKLRIVSALQAKGLVAAMTGDGVNDAPALRKADIGVAMGITGSSVAKNSASLILLDDNFTTIVTAVREGRRIYDNLRKYIRQALTANVAEVGSILFAFLLMGNDPLLALTPLMILWVNLISDGMPALTLGFEPEEHDVMKRQPRGRDESIFAGRLKEKILLRGLCVGAVTFAVFQILLSEGASLTYAQTGAFATLALAQLWHIFDARSTTTIFERPPFSNRYLMVAVVISLILSGLAIYTPFGQAVLHTEPLHPVHLAMAAGLASFPTLGLSVLNRLTGWRFL